MQRGSGGLSYRRPAFWPAGYGNIKVVSNWGFVNGVVVSGASWISGTATITTATPHLLWAGLMVNLTGITPTGYNGDFFVIATPTPTTFTVSVSVNPGAYASGGLLNSVPMDIQLATCEVVGVVRNTVKMGGYLSSESGGDYNYSINVAMQPMFGTVRQLLSPYRNVSDMGMA